MKLKGCVILFKKLGTWVLVILLLIGAVALVACGSDTPSGPAEAMDLTDHPLLGAWDAVGDGAYDYYRLVFHGDGSGILQEIGYPDLRFLWEVPTSGSLYLFFQGIEREEWTYSIVGDLLSKTDEDGLPWFYINVDPASPLPAPLS